MAPPTLTRPGPWRAVAHSTGWPMGVWTHYRRMSFRAATECTEGGASEVRLLQEWEVEAGQNR